MNNAATLKGKNMYIVAAIFVALLFGVHSFLYSPVIIDLVEHVSSPFHIGLAETPYLYWILHAFILIPIICLSFDRRVAFFKKWKYLLPAILLIGALFILWDFVYTKVGVWGFSHDYTLDQRILQLPIEEWMFFVSAPFACVFIYECLRYYFPKDNLSVFDKPISIGLSVILILIGVLTWGKLYTSFTCIATGVLILVHYLYIPNTYRTFFYKAQLVSFIPFFIVNGVLTGSITKSPIVQYNPDEMLDIRVLTIPVEDFIYCMILLFSVVIVYEYFQKKDRLSL